MLRLHKIKHVVNNHYSTNAKPFHEIPSPRSLPLVGTLFSFIAAGGGTHLHEYIDKRHQQFGMIFQEKLGPISSVFLNDAKEIRKVFNNEGKYPKHVLPDCWLLYNKIKGYQRGLYFMDGEEWYTYRKLLNEILLKHDYFENGIRNGIILEKTFETWLRNSKHGEIIDLENQLYYLSIIFMMSFTLGRSFHENVNIFLPHIEKLAKVVKDIFKWSVELSILPAIWARSLNLKIWRNFVGAIDESIGIITHLLKDTGLKNSDGIFHLLLEKNVPMDVTQRIIIDFLLAAGDTTALATLWILYSLGRHKSVQDDLYNDIKKNRGGYNSQLLKNVIRESLRLYPIAPFITRYLPKETEIASYLIPANHLISISVLNCSRNEKYFPNGNKFEPKRWERLPNGKYAEVNDPYATLPFAMGARSCIGRNLSKVQLLILINKLISLYELEVRNEVGVKLNLITIPSQPIQLFLKRR